MAASLLVLSMTVGSAAGSDLGESDPTPDGATAPPTSSEPPIDAGTGTTTGQVADCTAVAGPNYLGLACGSLTNGGLTVKEVLGKDPVPDCWNDKLSPSELDALGLENTPGDDGSTWYWERCLKGINPKTKTIRPGGVRFEVGLVSLPNGQAPKTLTDRQRDLVAFQGVDQQIPAPVVVASPSALPRVGNDISFFDPVDNEVEALAGAVRLSAKVTSTQVEPLGEDKGDLLTCEGAGLQADADDTPRNLPNACWYRYEQSSAGQTSDSDGRPAYPVMVTQEWTVTAAIGAGPEQEFATFEKSQVTALAVTEIQSLVIR